MNRRIVLRLLSGVIGAVSAGLPYAFLHYMRAVGEFAKIDPANFFDDSPFQKLLTMIRAGNVDEIDRLILAEKIDINAVSKNGLPLLFYAIGNHPHVFEHLLNLGAKPNPRILMQLGPGRFQDASLLTAVIKRYCLSDQLPQGMIVRYVESLLQHGADPNDVSPTNGETPIFEASCAYDSPLECLEILLRNGANPNHVNNKGETVLLASHSLASSRTAPVSWAVIALYLLENGADHRMMNANGICVTDYAVIDRDNLKKELLHEDCVQQRIADYEKLLSYLRNKPDGLPFSKVEEEYPTFVQLQEKKIRSERRIRERREKYGMIPCVRQEEKEAAQP